MKGIVITGVSTGIGHAAAADLVARGYHVFGSVRTAADGERLVATWGDAFTPLLFDVTDHDAIVAAATLVRERLNGDNLCGLVNNAGITMLGPLQHMSLADFRRQFDVNLIGLLDVTQQFLPLLGASHEAPRPRGRIVNISSISGRLAYPFFGAYAASKHGLEGLSDALRRELLIYDIDVVLIEPGTTQTPIIDKAGRQAEQYGATDYGQAIATMQGGAAAERRRTAIPVKRVSRQIITAIESPRPKTRYPIPRKWWSGWLIPRLLPDRWLDRLAARVLGWR